MGSIGSVVVPLDGSEYAQGALRPGRALAEALGASVVLVTVAAPGADTRPLDGYLAQCARDAGIDGARLEVVEGRAAAPAIVALARTLADAAVCMTSHGLGGLTRALLGSVAEAVVQDASCPVVLVGPKARDWAGPLGRVVACVDGSELAQAVVPIAAGIAAAARCPLWLVEVVDPGASAADSGEGAGEGAGRDVSEAATVHRLAAAVAPGAGTDVEWEVLHDRRPAAAIVRFVEGDARALLAITTHGRTGVARLVVGSVAGEVVRTAPVPVLTLRSPNLRH